MATHPINVHYPSLSFRCSKLGSPRDLLADSCCFPSTGDHCCRLLSKPLRTSRRQDDPLACRAVQPQTSAASTVEEKPAVVDAPAKPKRVPPAKIPEKPLQDLMKDDVIPPLRAILEAESELSEIELSFQDNQLEGSFVKNGIPYFFWAFFPTGSLVGPKGFSLSSHGSGPSTVEPFLIDEKKITGKHVVFWVEKRLAAQGILPVWREK